MKSKLMSITTVVLSLSLVALFIPVDNANENHQAFAVQASNIENTLAMQALQGIDVELDLPTTIYATQLTPVKIKISDLNSESPISHVDWAISVKDPNGNVIYKTTTAHSHAGIMNFNVAFPIAGENTVSLTSSSIGPKMMGMDVPAKARTHTLESGTLKGFESDPENNFGSRTFDFPVQVLAQKQLRTISGSEDGTRINVELASNSDKIVAGQPTTLILTTTDANSNEPIATHTDALISISKGNYITSQSDKRGSDMMPMNGAYHGHLGQISFTTTFPSAGNYIVNVDLNSLGVSNVKFGKASALFDVVVLGENGFVETSEKKSDGKTIEILGLEAPFYSPNTINIKSGETLTFDNVDANFHTVTSGNQATGSDGNFDSGLLSAGEKFTLTLDKPGTYQYYCTIHPNMVGTIIVS